jgi:hypothetical protein
MNAAGQVPASEFWTANSGLGQPNALVRVPPHDNLRPDLTSFVGRKNEMTRLVDHMRSARLLTLVGPGGVGKTRLATRLAARTVDSYGDGGCLVELANLSDPHTVPNAIACALRIAERARVPLT